MPLWRLRENESSIIIQQTSVLNFSHRSPLYIIISKGKLITANYYLFPLSKAQILEVGDEHEATVQDWIEVPSTTG